MTDNEALIPRIKAILADLRATSAESFQLQRLVVDYTERTVTTNDRERIAELERDLAHARTTQSETKARTIIAFCNESVGFAALGNSHVETAVKALYHRLTEARANLAQNAAITETLRAELGTLRAIDEQLPPSGTYRCDGCGSLWNERHALVEESPTYGACHCIDSPRYVYSLPSYVSLRPFVEAAVAPVVEEEQGPWVIYDAVSGAAGDTLAWCGRSGWRLALTDCVFFDSREHAMRRKSRLSEGAHYRVITLAEAHRIAGAK